jgi:hypothetical protein
MRGICAMNFETMNILNPGETPGIDMNMQSCKSY